MDRSPDRFKTLSRTIIVNRISVILACMLWYLIIEPPSFFRGREGLPDSTLKTIIFLVILFLGVFEALSATGNTLSMERDWIVVAASSLGQPYDLTALNATMRRIDLICKLVSPIFISMIISSYGIRTGVVMVCGMSACSIGLEWFCAKRVWENNAYLRVVKSIPSHTIAANVINYNILSHVKLFFLDFVADFRLYLQSIICIPSLALCLLHLSALAYSASLITFLLNVGITVNIITIVRAIGSIVEVSSTVVTPIGVDRLSQAKNHGSFYERLSADTYSVEASSKGNEIGLFRLGLWGLSWQVINLVPVVISLWSMASGTTSIFTSVTLFFFLSSSRLGLWIFDLTTQQLTQTMTVADQRSSFAGVENSFVSMFELLQNFAIIILSRPEQFRWIVLMSFLAVVCSTVVYATWVWKIRGHLVHWKTIMKSCECIRIRTGNW